jgi:hypothetical protein
LHRRGVCLAQPLDEPLSVNRADLIQPNRGLDMEAICFGWFNDDLNGIGDSGNFGSDGGNDCKLAVLVADVVLNNQRPSSLFNLVDHSGIK